MLADLSNSASEELPVLKAAFREGLAKRHRFWMVGLNFIPLLHVLATVVVLCLAPLPWPWRAMLGLSVLYLVPPLVARVVFLVAGRPEGHIQIGSRDFLAWWLSFQLQVLFCRISLLEEIVRIVPGLYSLWLRLWGAKIGRLTYWSPGTVITDRSFLDVGDNVVFGAGVRLNPHVLARDEADRLKLMLSPVRIGARAMIGGYSLLTAGTEIAAGEVTRAFLISPPFSVWSNGKRVRETKDSPGEQTDL